MVGEVLESLGRERVVAELAAGDSTRYEGLPPAADPIVAERADRALGVHERYADWLAFFRDRLADEPWRTVLSAWVPRLTPGLSGAGFHGLIRTAHAARALRRRETTARRGELAVGLAYWAARYLPLPSTGVRRPRSESHGETLARLEHPWEEPDVPVGYFAATRASMRGIAPFAPALDLENPRAPAEDLHSIVVAAASALTHHLEPRHNPLMIVHGVTGPAAVDLLLPHVDQTGARSLVEHAWQGAAVMFMSYGRPHPPEAARAVAVDWPQIVDRAVESWPDSHGLKLVEAMARFDRTRPDPALRAAAAIWTRVG